MNNMVLLRRQSLQCHSWGTAWGSSVVSFDFCYIDHDVGCVDWDACSSLCDMTRDSIEEINLVQVCTSISNSNMTMTAYKTWNPLFQQDLFLYILDWFVAWDVNVEAFRGMSLHFLSSLDDMCILWALPWPSLAQVDSLWIPTTPVDQDIVNWNDVLVIVLLRQTHIHTCQHQEAWWDKPRQTNPFANLPQRIYQLGICTRLDRVAWLMIAPQPHNHLEWHIMDRSRTEQGRSE